MMYTLYRTELGEGDWYVTTNDFAKIFHGEGYGDLGDAILFTTKEAAKDFRRRYSEFVLSNASLDESHMESVYEVRSIALSPAEQMRVRSGSVDSNDRLVTFLYMLARSEVPVGTVESLIEQLKEHEAGTEYQFCNGYLAEWAEDAAARLQE